jgi:hypothetical protein
VAALRGAVDSSWRAMPAARARPWCGGDGKRCRVTGGDLPWPGGAATKASGVQDKIRLLDAQSPLQGNRREKVGLVGRSALYSRACSALYYRA